MSKLNVRGVLRALCAGAALFGLAACVYAPPPAAYGYAPAPGYAAAPAPGYYAAPAYAYAPPVSIGLGFGGGYWGGGGRWR
jgi:hypothetical protein